MPICPVDMYQGYADECLSCNRRMECLLVVLINKVERLETIVSDQSSVNAILNK